MNGNVVRSIAAVAVGALLVVAGGSASADTVGGKGTSSAQAAGNRMLELRDQLVQADRADDTGSTKDIVDRLGPPLSDLSAGRVYTTDAEVRETAATAQAQRDEVAQALPDTSVAQQQPPESLEELEKLLDRLVQAISDLVEHLLNSVPAPPGTASSPR
jgi:Mg2+ and Co2+ transporter CorA